jgi:hypothetical protein
LFWPSPIPLRAAFGRRGDLRRAEEHSFVAVIYYFGKFCPTWQKKFGGCDFFTRLRQGFGVAGHRSASAQRSGETGGAAITDMGSGRSRATDFGRNIEYPEDLTELTKRTEARDIPACRPTMSRQFFGKFSRRRFKLRGVDFS